MLRKTRHENLVLFMGACMKVPHLAIVIRYVIAWLVTMATMDQTVTHSYQITI